jgi:hypothetical protein
VIFVVEDSKDAAAVSTAPNSSRSGRKDGFEVELQTEVVRVQDDVPIASGVHKVWVKSY